jgi:autotransporter-associated beta strand protein
LTLAGGTFEGFGVTITNNVVAQNGSTTTVQLSGAGDVNLNGNLSGGGTLNAQYGAGSGTHTIALAGNNSSFTGTYTAANNNSVRYSFNSTNAGSSNAVWVLNNYGPANNSGIGFGLGTGILYFGALSGNGGMRGTATLNIGGLNTNATWSGNISANNGTISVVKSGTGTEIFSAANTYSGTTEVRNGTLIVSNTLASSAVTVDAADGPAFLAGVGTISHLVTLTKASAYTAGINLSNGFAGTLTLSGGLTLNSGNVLSFDVAGAASSDQIAITGAVNLPSSGTVTVNLNNIGVSGAATIKLIGVTSGSVAMDYTKFNLATTAPSGFTWSLQNDSDGYSLDLVIAPTAPANAFWNGAVSANWSAANSGSSYNWVTTAGGGTSSGKPGKGTAAILSGNSPVLHNSTMDAAFEVGSLEFNDPAGTTISDSGSHSLQVDGSLTVDSGAGAVAINVGSYVLTNNAATIANNSASTLTIGSPISGAYMLTINSSGSGATTLAGNNSYTGGTTVSAGTLVLSGNNPSVTGATTVNTNGVLQLQNAGAIVSSALTLNNGATLNLRANTDTTFATASIAGIANSGIVSINADQITSGGGNGSHTLALTNSVSLGANATLNVSAGSGDTLALGNISIAAGNAYTETVSNNATGTMVTIAGVTASGVYDYFGFSGDGNIAVLGTMLDTAMLCRNLLISGASVRG